MTMLCTFVYWGVRYVNNLISKGLFFNPTYLTLPKKAAHSDAEVDERVRLFLEREKILIESEDEEFRFHSGVVTPDVLDVREVERKNQKHPPAV